MTTNSRIRLHNGQAVMSRLAPTRALQSRHPWLHFASAASVPQHIGFSSGVPRSSFAWTNSLQPLLLMMLSSAALSARLAYYIVFIGKRVVCLLFKLPLILTFLACGHNAVRHREPLP